VAGRTFFGAARLAILLAVLIFVALGAWLDHRRSTDWDGTLRVTVYPVAVDVDSATTRFVAGLDADAFSDVTGFMADEAARYGVEIDEPVVTPKALELTLTNEVGVEGKVRLLKNIAGLWLVQECRRAWILEGKEYTYAELTEMAAGADPFLAVIDPDQFLDPGHMPERIAAYCRRTGQPVPERPGRGLAPPANHPGPGKARSGRRGRAAGAAPGRAAGPAGRRCR
jgi:hypothetical protein